MPRQKKIKTLTSETSESTIDKPIEVKVAEESDAKKRFRAFMESYKLEKPAKYAAKEAAFIQHLNTL